ncbi:MAG: PSD1 and planctomycete cytochrome C domain-containing protein [Rhodothermales bacterium]|nr:PSD1 and planctomycete cytochrome C domain-containing protein [Rhodothermales bacterium]
MTWRTPLLLMLSVSLAAAGLAAFRFARTPVSFNDDIRPVLNANCLRCHGGVRQAGGFSLLFPDEAQVPGESGRIPIVPGQPDSSEVIRRIRHSDPEERMPFEHPPLSGDQIDLLTRWIEAGAPFETHWAYVPPDSTLTPPDISSPWIRNDIDRFILTRLEAQDLVLSPEAACYDLLRRLALDLTGLPLAPDQADAYCRAPGEKAYLTLVDSLLATPAYGEHLAATWLDLARYADTKGYRPDLHREIWPYRDWVIEAFNADMPFDRFTIEQLAGDLLPDPTISQRTATAFHRNSMASDEGGTDDEEFRVAGVIDRVNTTWEVWMGTTMVCVQCHSHPYDPFRHEEYFTSYAFFNNTADTDHYSEAPHLATYDALRADSVHTPIMMELEGDARRVTHRFTRGNWLDPAEVVEPGVPGSLPAMAPELPRNRLGFARWIVSPDHPLTSRVLANRLWAGLFGRGIVQTLEDFGTQGEPPTHSELLDWLAVRLRTTHGWRIKPFLREIVLSATYRQTSRLTPELLEQDPANLWLARGPRVRLSAEQIRDQGLVVSGLLHPSIGGPSVMPAQPPGIWSVQLRPQIQWKNADNPEDRRRRALYTYWRRSSPYPSMAAFDSPSREQCVSRRVSTNTPLQAFVTLNDPVYVEMARGLASRMAEAGPGLEDQITHGYRLTLLAPPSSETLGTLTELHHAARARYAGAPADTLAAAAGPLQPATPERAALVQVASALLNLDAFIMKP